MHRPVHSEPGVIRLLGRSDTDWAQDKVTRKSRTCLHVLADGCLLSSVVRRQSFIAMSSAEAEFGGLHIAAFSTFPFKMFFEWLGFRVLWHVETDGSAARATAFRAGVGKVRHMDIRLMRTQDAVKRPGLKADKVLGTENSAGLGTKRHSGPDHAE